MRDEEGQKADQESAHRRERLRVAEHTFALVGVVGSGGSVQMRESAKTLFMEAKPAAAPASAWVHRNYLAR